VVTGSTRVLLEKARYGGTPPEIANIVGTPGYTSGEGGRTTSVGAGDVVCGCTVTTTTTVCPIASWIVTLTFVSRVTGLASSVTALPVTTCATGNTAVLLENALYGATPPTIVSVDAVPENTSALGGHPDKLSRRGGKTLSAGGGVVGCGCTVTFTVAVCPTESWTVRMTAVLAGTAPARSGTVLPVTVCGTGNTVGLLENARKGAT